MGKTITLPFNYEPREYQLPLCRAVDSGYKRAVSVWHRRAGKDKTLLNIMVKKAFERVGSYFYFFPTYKQGRMILWEGKDRDGFAFLDHIPEELVKRKLDQEMKIELKNGSVIRVVGTDDIDRIVGTNPVGCVFSEYALQRPEAWAFIRPILRENGGWAIFNFTPRGLNHGFDIYQMALKSEDWFCELLTVNDTKRPDGSPVFKQEDIEQERLEGMSESMIRQEYYCDFTASSDNVLIALDIILKAAGKVIHPSAFMYAPKVLGVDVARFGDDRSSFITRQGLASYGQKTFQGLDNMQLADAVAHEINQKKHDAVFIDAGRGEGVIDRLRQLGYEVIEVNFGGKPLEPSRYVNKRAEMYDLMREWMEAGGSIPDDQELKTDLSIPTYSFDHADRKKLMSKEKMKEDYGFSPDIADSLALTFSANVVPPAERMTKNPGRAKTEYDPFAREEQHSHVAVMDYDMYK